MNETKKGVHKVEIVLFKVTLLLLLFSLFLLFNTHLGPFIARSAKQKVFLKRASHECGQEVNPRLK